MTNLPPTIRKAAILVSTLDERSADALFESMGTETAARVRSAVVELDDVSSDEQQQVLAEFLRGGKPAESYDEDGVELDLLGPDRPDAAMPRSEPIPAPAGPFDFLQEVPPGRTAALLAGESPQTIAVIIARLDARLAAQLLEHLPAALATDVLERLAWLEEPAADVLADVERQLRLALAPFCETQSSAPSLAGLQKLVGAMSGAMRERMLAGLGQRNADLARRLGYERPEDAISLTRYRIDRHEGSLAPARKAAPLVEFEDLLTLSDEALKRVFSAADPQVVLLALTGAPEALVTRIVRGLPSSQSATLRRRLNHPGAIRLSDIAAAQEQLAAVARRLAEEGTIVLAGSRHFAAAA